MWTFTIASSVLLTVPQQSYAKLSQKALSVHEFCNSFLFKISFIFLREGREGERKGNKHWCERETSLNFLSYAPQLETEPATQAHAPIGNWTHDLSLCRMMPNEVSHTGELCNSES